jgi:uncharacterized protein
VGLTKVKSASWLVLWVCRIGANRLPPAFLSHLYGTTITLQMLSQVEQAELALRQMGFRQLRVRHHNDIARLEVEASDFDEVLRQREQIAEKLKQLGYTYVTLDLSGFHSGSLNKTLRANGH